MKYLKVFENFEDEPIEDEFIENDDLNSDDYDEQLEKDLSIELEYKLRTLEDDSKFTIDDFLIEFGINPEDMTGFAWAAILNGTKEYKEMSDDEFMSLYDEYKLESTLEPSGLDYEIDDEVYEATSGSVDNKNSKAYKSLKKKSEASGTGLTILKQ